MSSGSKLERLLLNPPAMICPYRFSYVLTVFLLAACGGSSDSNSPATGGSSGTGAADAGASGGASGTGTGGTAGGGTGGNPTGGAAGATTGGTAGAGGVATGGAAGTGGAATGGAAGTGGAATGGAAGTGGGAGVACGAATCQSPQGCLTCFNANPATAKCISPFSESCQTYPNLHLYCDDPSDCKTGEQCSVVEGSIGTYAQCFQEAACTQDCTCGAGAFGQVCSSLSDCPTCAKKCEAYTQPGNPGVKFPVKVCTW